MTTFTTEQQYLCRATVRHACILRDLNYAHDAKYPEHAASELSRLDAAIKDIKTRMTKNEIKECS